VPKKELAAQVHAMKRAKTELRSKSQRIAEQTEGKTEPEEKAEGPEPLFAVGASGRECHVAFFKGVFSKKEVAGFVALVSTSISRLLCLSLPCWTADGRPLRS
jgi:hypothetical protein